MHVDALSAAAVEAGKIISWRQCCQLHAVGSSNRFVHRWLDECHVHIVCFQTRQRLDCTAHNRAHNRASAERQSIALSGKDDFTVRLEKPEGAPCRKTRASVPHEHHDVPNCDSLGPLDNRADKESQCAASVFSVRDAPRCGGRSGCSGIKSIP